MLETESYLRSPVLSMRLAVLTVSPNKQYLGILVPFLVRNMYEKYNKFCNHFQILCIHIVQ